jgi:hypothetical protein
MNYWKAARLRKHSACRLDVTISLLGATGMGNRIAWSVTCVAIVCGAAHAQTSLDGMTDEVQDYRAKAAVTRSWVPVPAIITEPAIGYGLGLALLYMSSSSPSAVSDTPQDDSTIRAAPPNITGVGGFATGTHSAGAAIGHSHSWDQLTGETEVRWYANSKWSLLAFGGLGKAYGRLHGFSEAPVAYGFGSGVRYLIDSKLGLTMGLDIARGPQQNAFYVQLGSAWR